VTDQTVGFFDLSTVLSAARPQLDAAWGRVLAHGQFVGGPEIAEFETAFAEFCSAPACVGVGNGTDAIELALLGLGVAPGTEVIVPTNTFVATPAAVSNIGAIPRFVDVDEATLLLTPEIAEAAITERTSAIIAVHLFGQPCDMSGLSDVARDHGLILMEDAAQAHGAEFDGQRIGTHSAAATFSFYPGKNLGALGDGGAVVTKDPVLADRVRSLSAHGASEDDRHTHVAIGRNSRLDTLQAALLQVRLGTLETENAHRRLVRTWYEELLPSTAPLVTQAPGRLSAHHQIVAQVEDRGALKQRLQDRGVSTGIHYPTPCHLQPSFAHLPPAELPVAERAASRILSLPLWSHIERSQVEYVCEQIRSLAPAGVG